MQRTLVLSIFVSLGKFIIIKLNKMAVKRDSSFQYTEYSGIDALPQKIKDLAISAKKAAESSYSPYSKFAVGAAVLLENGEVILGSNQENGAYPSGICAERVALFYAGATYPNIPVVSIAVAAFFEGKLIAEPVAPCGACRQVMIETQNIGKKPYSVVMLGERKVVVVEDVKFLLPFAFSNITDAIKE
jgi:cytidine deaminase